MKRCSHLFPGIPFPVLAFLMIIILLQNTSCKKQPAETPAPPNIILIIADDVSPGDIGCYGNRLVKTAHIDALAETGLRFTNVFLTASSCGPSRTSILTGSYPHNTGAAALHTPLPAHLTYFPEQLQKSVYFTALAGKCNQSKNNARAYDTVLNQRKRSE